ncbi:ATP-dependent RNA helicase DeaD, partial [Haemophilus influenzae]
NLSPKLRNNSNITI